MHATVPETTSDCRAVPVHLMTRPSQVPTSAPTLTASPPLSPPAADSRASPRGSPRLRATSGTTSPNRRIHRSSSPGLLHSPASSQIFERNVQDSVVELDRSELSPHLPAHIQTEDHIPPVLEASSKAITDNHLNPDDVEIVMHAAHQPVSAAVAGNRDSIYSPTPTQDESSALASQADVADTAANYGSIDTTDVRRLSFISFADVVQAEHVENDRDAVQMMSLASTANRSPSPMRSPTSSHGFSASPPTSGAASEKGAEYLSQKAGRVPNSPTVALHGAHSPPLGGGELQIETMRQALRKTRSGDLGGVRSQPLSAESLTDGGADAPSK
ncbi:hypothetical protein M011DRAFT_400645 [Sporormia fimetaria CBS 119925]|uniref:Uncharacterized protein n=1 Tax=Sporormia fimetaria CBS 119925 TaxID=1340428 RepID=A0A6A6VGK4_9PLEO|nr:hypothetical protein M011DRAFT_400645 [Sporormia fimetaria CBS 119925]